MTITYCKGIIAIEQFSVEDMILVSTCLIIATNYNSKSDRFCFIMSVMWSILAFIFIIQGVLL